MITVDNALGLKEQIARLRRGGKRVAFVPTMGNLHAGHLRLMQEARQHGQVIVASIYVNPLQFAEDEDFAAYPRTMAHDKVSLLSAGVDVLFKPAEAEMYPHGHNTQTFIEVPGLSHDLCGAFRPKHFRGVTTVVYRLLNMVAPDVAIFGKKDYQQWVIVSQMVSDLGLPIDIVGVDTARETDGLAMSSRNNYLSADERKLAPALYETICRLRDQVQAHGGVSREAEANALASLKSDGFRPDYVSVRRQLGLANPGPEDRRLVALAAAWLGKTRLIDNVEFQLNQ